MTSPRGAIVITTHSIGAVDIEMNLAQAEAASGETLHTEGDGQYTGRTPSLEYETGYGSQACTQRSRPAQ